MESTGIGVDYKESPKSRVRNGMVLIPLVSVRASAGSGEVPYREEIEEYVSFNQAALSREVGVSPSRLVVLRVSGSSMEPTLRPGEAVMVALSDSEEPIDSAIYVLRVYDALMIKRLFIVERDRYLLKGDNPEHPPIEVQKGDDCRIIGRVVRGERHF